MPIQNPTLGMKKFSSSAFPITAAGALTIPHGLGTVPLIYEFLIQCVTSQYGYNVGDTTVPAMEPTQGRGVSITYDATNFYIRYGSSNPSFAGFDKSTGAGVIFTNANWNFIINAIA